MGLTLIEVGTSAVVGIADIATEEIDAYKGFTKPLQNITDWERIAWVGGGLALNYMGKVVSSDTSKVMVVSGLPLLEKTIYRAVKKLTGITTPLGKKMGLQLIRSGEGGFPTAQQMTGGAGGVRWG